MLAAHTVRFGEDVAAAKVLGVKGRPRGQLPDVHLFVAAGRSVHLQVFKAVSAAAGVAAGLHARLSRRALHRCRGKNGRAERKR
jgi:hypothetical protein